jgi:hypothetical protein
LVRSKLFPISARSIDEVSSLITECVQAGLVIPYQWDGKDYLQLTKWQRCSPCERSRFPWEDGSFQFSYVKRITKDGDKDFVASSIPSASHPNGICIPSPSHNGGIPPLTTASCPTRVARTETLDVIRYTKEEEIAVQQKSAEQPKPRISISDDDFIAELKKTGAYDGIDVDREFGKMRAFFLTPKGKNRKLTRTFAVRWLNRIERPMQHRNGHSNGPLPISGELPPIMPEVSEEQAEKNKDLFRSMTGGLKKI